MPEARYEIYLREYTWLFAVYIGGSLLAILLYGETFVFFEYPLSGLGATETVNGFPNRPAMLVFVADMIVVGILLVIISVTTARDRTLNNRGLRSVLAATGGFGAFIATFPHNVFPVQHTLGSAFLVGSLWLLAVFFIRDAGALVSTQKAVWLHLLLHVTVISYAIAYTYSAASKQVFQKLAIAGLCAALLASIRTLCKAARPAQVESDGSAEEYGAESCDDGWSPGKATRQNPELDPADDGYS